MSISSGEHIPSFAYIVRASKPPAASAGTRKHEDARSSGHYLKREITGIEEKKRRGYGIIMLGLTLHRGIV
jgi:hypothetical protein